jgi:hypothetical protein
MTERKRIQRRTRMDIPMFTETRVRGTPSPPGTPVSTSCWPPYEKIKHLLSNVPLARPGDPWPPARKASKRKSTTKRRRRRA